jgi:hypothetical protein
VSAEGEGDAPDGPPGDSEDDAAFERVARAVVAGEDGIELPPELTADTDSAAPPPEGMLMRIRGMTVGERIKLALRGNKEARAVLLRDSNRVILRLVLQNPRITEDELIGITHNRTADDEVLRQVAVRRDWTKVYQVRAGLVANPRTPITIALRFLPTLGERDIRQLAKSKNVPDAVAGAARRIVATRQIRNR